MNWDGTVHPLATLFPQLQQETDWCSGCGLGIVWQALLRAISTLKDPHGQSNVDDYLLLISGLGCLGLIDKLSPLQVNQASPEKLGEQALKIARQNPKRKVVLLVSDPDVLVGGVTTIFPSTRSPRAKAPPSVVLTLFINLGLGFLFSRARGQLPSSVFDSPDCQLMNNLPEIARQAGAISVSRWTSLHMRRLTRALKIAFSQPRGFSFIEVIAPCLMIWAPKEKLGESVQRMTWLREMAEIYLEVPGKVMDLSQGERFVIGFLKENSD